MENLFEKIQESKNLIQSKVNINPDFGIILGTGLGKLADNIESAVTVEYEDIPHFPQSTVESHKGRLIFGTICNKKVAVMQGRFHFYEGYTLQQVSYPVRVLKALGINTLIVSNACGGLNPAFNPGDIMLIRDHINLLGNTPLVGKNDYRLGTRFPDMFECYNPNLIEKAKEFAKKNDIDVHTGVYAVMSGPCLETAAEYRMLKIIGADAIGMSTVPEVITAIHSKLKVFGISVITDKCDPDNLKPVNIEEIIATADKAEPKLVKIVKGLLEKL